MTALNCDQIELKPNSFLALIVSMNCILLQKFRILVSVLQSLCLWLGWRKTLLWWVNQTEEQLPREAVPSPFLEVSNQDWINSEQLDLTMTLLWAQAWTGRFPQGPFHPELSPGPGFVSVFLLYEIYLKSGFLSFCELQLSFHLWSRWNQCRSCEAEEGKSVHCYRKFTRIKKENTNFLCHLWWIMCLILAM